MHTKIEFRHISDRHNLIEVMETRKRGLEPYMIDRTDMYWAEVNVTDYGLNASLSYSIDYNERTEEFTFTHQYGPSILDSDELRKKMRNKWEKIPEYRQALKWVDDLIRAGYFDHGCVGAPNANYRRCKHCGAAFEVGTSHPHTWLRDFKTNRKERIIYHHKLMEKTCQKLGLTRIGLSALPDIPSLEERGELEPYIIV